MRNEYFDIVDIYIPYLEDLKTPILTPKEYGMYKLNKRSKKHKKHNKCER